MARVTATAVATEYVLIQATVGSMMIDGNIAVDDITLTFGACGEAILFNLGDLTNQPG